MKKQNRDELLVMWIHRMQGRAMMAKKQGLLKPERCKECKSKKVHMHHASYLEQDALNIIWLCSKHHIKWHLDNQAIYPQVERIKEKTDEEAKNLENYEKLYKKIKEKAVNIYKKTGCFAETARETGMRKDTIRKYVNEICLLK